MRIDLGLVSAESELKGRRLVFGAWGKAPGQFGISRGSRVGPASFDVTHNGRLVIADQQNHRLVIASRRDRIYLPVGLPPVFVDVAATDREVAVLVINAGPAGADRLNRYGLDGSPLGTAVVGDEVDNVRIFDGDLFLSTPRDGWVAADAAPSSGGSGIPTVTGGEITTSGGLGHAVTITRTEPTGARAWGLTSDMNLGVEAVAATPKGVHAVLVHWTDSRRIYQYVDLTRRGLASEVVLPDQQYAEMTAGSTFRFTRDTLYQAMSTPAGFGIYTYRRRTNAAPAVPQPSSNKDLLGRALRLLTAVGVRQAGQTEPPHGSPAESLHGNWRGHDVQAGVIPSHLATPPSEVLDSYQVAGRTVTVLRSHPFLVHQFTLGQDTWSIVCSTPNGAASDRAATTRLVRSMIHARGSR